MKPNRLTLPNVTLCAVTSVNVPATMRALIASMEHIDFAACKLLTDADIQMTNCNIISIPIRKLQSSDDYSNFVLKNLVDYIDTSYALLVQWDGHVINAEGWNPEFLNYDYIGASWPQFEDGYDVGNGGFSLRSRRLMQACLSERFEPSHPEDVAIGRENRAWLEEEGFKFAPRSIADTFSVERTGDLLSAFGYHGAWNMPQVLGREKFWQVYKELDSRNSIWNDLFQIGLKFGFLSPIRLLRLIRDRSLDLKSRRFSGKPEG